MKKREWTLIAAAVVLGAVVLIIGINSPKPAVQNDSGFDPLNAAYTVNGQPVYLLNGLSQTQAAPGSASLVTTRIFGEPVSGDLNGDGRPDAALLITQDGGGSGTFFYVAAALAEGATTVGTNAFYIGDRVAPQNISIKDGVITVNYADRAAGEPMSTPPSVGVSKYFAVQNGSLGEIGQ